LEVFNLFSRINYNNPANTITAPNFGEYVSAGSKRQVQFLKPQTRQREGMVLDHPLLNFCQNPNYLLTNSSYIFNMIFAPTLSLKFQQRAINLKGK